MNRNVSVVHSWGSERLLRVGEVTREGVFYASSLVTAWKNMASWRELLSAVTSLCPRSISCVITADIPADPQKLNRKAIRKEGEEEGYVGYWIILGWITAAGHLPYLISSWKISSLSDTGQRVWRYGLSENLSLKTFVSLPSMTHDWVSTIRTIGR